MLVSSVIKASSTVIPRVVKHTVTVKHCCSRNSGNSSRIGGSGSWRVAGGLGRLKPDWLVGGVGPGGIEGGNGAEGRVGLGILVKKVPKHGEMVGVVGVWRRREGCEGAEVVESAHPRAGAREKNGRGYPCGRVKKDPRGEPAGGGGGGLAWLEVSNVRFGCAAQDGLAIPAAGGSQGGGQRVRRIRARWLGLISH